MPGRSVSSEVVEEGMEDPLVSVAGVGGGGGGMKMTGASVDVLLWFELLVG